MLPTSVQRGPAHEHDRLRDAARGLEALVLKQLVTASNAFGGGQGAGSAIRADLFASTLADSLVKGGGIGLAAQLERTLAPGDGAAPGGTAPHLHLEARPPASNPARALRGYGSPQPAAQSGLNELLGRADDGSGAGS